MIWGAWSFHLPIISEHLFSNFMWIKNTMFFLTNVWGHLFSSKTPGLRRGFSTSSKAQRFRSVFCRWCGGMWPSLSGQKFLFFDLAGCSFKWCNNGNLRGPPQCHPPQDMRNLNSTSRSLWFFAKNGSTRRDVWIENDIILYFSNIMCLPCIAVDVWWMIFFDWKFPRLIGLDRHITK